MNIKVYTLGYHKLKPQDILQRAEYADCVVFDIRHVPVSRTEGFNKIELEALLGNR